MDLQTYFNRKNPFQVPNVESACCAVAALDLLNALEGMHKAGYIHRDVKPANFALYQGPGARSMATGGDWRIIDFGIARRFVDEDGNPLPKREAFGEFRGSTTYASIHAHLKQDLGEAPCYTSPIAL